jgi:hypothetical protein
MGTSLPHQNSLHTLAWSLAGLIHTFMHGEWIERHNWHRKIGSTEYGTGLGGLVFLVEYYLYIALGIGDTRAQGYGSGIGQRSSIRALIVANV